MCTNAQYTVPNDAHSPTGRPAVDNDAASGRVRSVEPLLNYAVDRGVPVSLPEDEVDILQHAIQESEEATRTIMEGLLSGYSTLRDTCRILSSNLPEMMEKYPKLMKKYLEMDRFSIEYGRLSVPSSLFEDTDRQTVAMMTDEEFPHWTSPGNVAVAKFWIRNCPQCLEAFLSKKERKQSP